MHKFKAHMFTLYGDMWNTCCDQAAPGAHTKLQPFQHVTTKHQAELQPLYIIYIYIVIYSIYIIWIIWLELMSLVSLQDCMHCNVFFSLADWLKLFPQASQHESTDHIGEAWLFVFWVLSRVRPFVLQHLAANSFHKANAWLDLQSIEPGLRICSSSWRWRGHGGSHRFMA